MNFNDTVAIVGAGFSKNAGIPLTRELNERFLELPSKSQLTPEIDTIITNHLQDFWKDVFRYHAGKVKPTFEDHFTLLDLAANSGHNLGPNYTPAKLRALRRLSIHRVFEVLDRSFEKNSVISEFVRAFCKGNRNAFVSTNWDIVVENHITERRSGGAFEHFSYGIEGIYGRTLAAPTREQLPIIKLHGSANWQYCDCCRHVVFGLAGRGKTSLTALTFVEPEDFVRLGEPRSVIEHVRRMKGNAHKCPTCESQLSARVATFSYSKAFDYFQFRGSWEAALRRLITAKRWIFIGYSLPEADFELRHLLKTAELASRNKENKTIEVVLTSDGAASERYSRFFGSKIKKATCGFEQWVDRL